MNRFSDLKIKSTEKVLVGEKINIMKLLNREITVHDFMIKPSKFSANDGCPECLYLQISIGDKNHVVFVGSSVLIKTIRQVLPESFPFITTIVEENKRYEFT